MKTCNIGTSVGIKKAIVASIDETFIDNAIEIVKEKNIARFKNFIIDNDMVLFCFDKEIDSFEKLLVKIGLPKNSKQTSYFNAILKRLTKNMVFVLEYDVILPFLENNITSDSVKQALPGKNSLAPSFNHKLLIGFLAILSEKRLYNSFLKKVSLSDVALEKVEVEVVVDELVGRDFLFDMSMFIEDVIKVTREKHSMKK